MPVAAQHPANLFTAAGFKVQVADTPEKLAHLRRLPAEKLVTRSWGGKVHYIYADPTACRCAYVGTPEAYRAYQTGRSDGSQWPGGREPGGEQMIDAMTGDDTPTQPGAPSFDDFVFGGIRTD
jgi:hypothetical protein